MNALVCTVPGQFAYQEAEKPILTPGHAILKIKQIGICGTDLHAFEGTQPFFSYPRLGHELATELVEADGAPDFQPGEAITFLPYFNCGHCIACRSGKPNCCATLQVSGIHIDGGTVSHPEFHKREATLMSSRNATRADFEFVIDSMKKGRINPTTYITHRVDFRQVSDEFASWLDPATGVIKTMETMG